MEVGRYLLRAELRRRRAGIALLAVLVALISSSALASAAGAVRTRSSFDRYLDRLNGVDLFIERGEDPVPTAAIDRLDGVAAAVGYTWYAAFPDDGRGGFYPMMVMDDDRIPTEFFRSPLVDGRQPDPAAPREVALGERTARRLGVGVGDEVPVPTVTEASMGVFRNGLDFASFDGPVVSLQVVGIVRNPGDIGGREEDIDITFLTPAFGEEFGDQLGVFAEGALVAAVEGESASRIAGEIVALADVQVDAILGTDALSKQVDPTLAAMAGALEIVAALIVLAGAIGLAQGSARAALDGSEDGATLRSLGVSRSAELTRVAAPGVVAAAVGVTIGCGLSALASGYFPRGVAGRAEPAPGISVDARVLLGGGALLFVVLAGVVVVTTAVVQRQARRTATTARTPALARAAGALRVEVASGIRLALEPGRGRRATPVRTATVAIASAVAGVLAATIVGASIHHAATTHEIYGTGWDGVLVGQDSDHIEDGEVDLDGLAGDEAFTAVAEIYDDLEVTVGGTPLAAVTIQDRRGHMPFVMVRGTEPRGRDEVALGANTLDQLGVRVGSTVDVSAGGPSRPMRVVGVVALPVSGDGGTNTEGVAMNRAAADAVGFDGDCSGDDVACSRNIALRAPADTDLDAAVAPYLAADARVAVELPVPPADVDRLAAVETTPRVLAVVLALIGLIAISHVAVMTVRRRRGDLALLRVLGFTAGQLRTTVGVQLGVLAIAGTIAGGAAGLMIGNWVWRTIAADVAIPAVVERPVIVLVAVPFGTLLLAILLSVPPARRAALLAPAVALRDAGRRAD